MKYNTIKYPQCKVTLMYMALLSPRTSLLVTSLYFKIKSLHINHVIYIYIYFFYARPDRPWGPPSLMYNGYRVSSPGLKRPGRGVNHPSPSSAEVMQRVEINLCCPSGI